MRVLPAFLLRVFRVSPRPDQGRERMVIVIRQLYAYLEEELGRVFEEQDDVQIILDKRRGERRTTRQPVAHERRRAERRRRKEVLLEVAM